MTFVLDLDDNPHPELLGLAVAARQRARDASTNFAAQAYYLGILHACVAATGCDLDQMVAWVERHAGEVETSPLQIEAMIESLRLVFAAA